MEFSAMLAEEYILIFPFAYQGQSGLMQEQTDKLKKLSPAIIIACIAGLLSFF
jgi:hypothetical protein